MSTNDTTSGSPMQLVRLIAPYKGLWVGATIALLAAGLVNLSLPQIIRIAIIQIQIIQIQIIRISIIVW